MSEQEIDYLKRISELEKRIEVLEKFEHRIELLERRLTLVSDIDRYKNLQESLVAQNFQEADLETSKLLLEATGRQDINEVTPADVKKISCNTLRIIDRLWRENSEQRFGYSVQLSLYFSVGGNANTLQTQDVQTFRKFGDLIGWRVNGQWQIDNYEQWNFTIEALRGYFPATSWRTAYGLKTANYFLTRLLECELTI